MCPLSVLDFRTFHVIITGGVHKASCLSSFLTFFLHLSRHFNTILHVAQNGKPTEPLKG